MKFHTPHSFSGYRGEGDEAGAGKADGWRVLPFCPPSDPRDAAGRPDGLFWWHLLGQWSCTYSAAGGVRVSAGLLCWGSGKLDLVAILGERRPGTGQKLSGKTGGTDGKRGTWLSGNSTLTPTRLFQIRRERRNGELRPRFWPRVNLRWPYPCFWFSVFSFVK